jgi:hypothetical protein
MQKTANQIKSEFELLASGHFQIHSFLYAQEFEQQAYENLIYPLMLVYPLGGNLSGTTYSRNYRVIIADRVLKSEGNELEVESDTQLIALDVLAYWMKLGQNERFSITSSNTITPFWEKWGDEVTGHFVDIGIEEFYDFNSCAIPLSSAIPSPTNPCKDARILINSVIYGNAPSDTNFNVVVKDQLGALVGSLIGGEWIVNTGGVCADATYTIEDSLGNVLYTGTIPSGGSATEVIGNSTLNVNKSDGTPISSRSILAEGTDSYNVGDSSAVLKDESGNVLSTTPIKATETEDIVAPNGDVSVNSVAFDDVLSGGTLNIQVRKSTGNDLIGSKQGQYWRIGDSTAVIKDSANNTLKSEAIKATETENITINDSSVENSDATYSVDILAEGSLILPDSQINVNGVDRGDVVSVKTIDVNLEDSVGAPVTPTSVGLVGNTLTIEVPSGGGSYDLDLVDRFGNAFPTKQVSANAIWDLRTLTPFDWADIFLTNATGSYTTGEENAIIQAIQDWSDAGIWEKRTHLYLFTGKNATDNSINCRYPFLNESSGQLVFSGSPTHNSNGITYGAGTFSQIRCLNRLFYPTQNVNVGIYSRTNNLGSTPGATDIGPETISPVNMLLRIRQSGGSVVYGDGAANTSATNPDSLGYFTFNAISGTNASKVVKNGNTGTPLSTITATTNNANTSIIQMGVDTGRNIAGAAIGLSLTDTQMQDDYTIWQQFQTDFNGRQV